MTLRDAWEAEARNWVAWARVEDHYSYWQFHRQRIPLFLHFRAPGAAQHDGLRSFSTSTPFADHRRSSVSHHKKDEAKAGAKPAPAPKDTKAGATKKK